PFSRCLTVTSSVPWSSSTCTVLSLTLVSVTLVSELMRIKPSPTFSSAREFLSAHTRSEVVSGRFRPAATHSFTPPGCMETSPEVYCRRATRPGGSCAFCPGALPPAFGYCCGGSDTLCGACARALPAEIVTKSRATKNHPNRRRTFILRLLSPRTWAYILVSRGEIRRSMGEVL